MNRNRVVFLGITVPDSIYCYHRELGYKCKYFNELLGCYHNFKPIKISGEVYEKDKGCLRLAWKE